MPVLEDSELDFHLHGSYSGKPVGPQNAVIYGFDIIDSGGSRGGSRGAMEPPFWQGIT